MKRCDILNIEILNKHIIKIKLSFKDMKNYNLTYEQINYHDKKTRQLIVNLLYKIKKTTKADISKSQIFIEAFPTGEKGCILYLNIINKKTIENTSNLKINRPLIVKFKQIQDFENMCKTLTKKNYIKKILKNTLLQINNYSILIIYSHNEQLLVDYILQNPQEVIEMDSKTLCQKCFVSTSTLYRLCEKLGLSGFSGLKVKISNSLHSYQKDVEQFDFDFPVKEYQTHHEIIDKIKEDYDKILISTENLFDLEQLRLSVHAMKKAKHIDIYTSAGHIYFAQNFQFQMKEIGVDVQVPVDEYVQRLTAAGSDSTHFAIIISFEGRAILTETLMNMLKEKKHQSC